MDKFYFGAHIETYKDGQNLIYAAEKVLNAGGNLIQIFLTVPGQVKTGTRTKEELEKFREWLFKHNMKVVVHSSYIHNLARDWDEYSWWMQNLELEIEYAHYIDAIGLVLHFGKSLELSLTDTYNNMYSSLIHVHNATMKYKDVKILLETSTGQGTEICYKLEDLAHFYKKLSKNSNKEIKERFRLCIDTCHIFSAGYNLKTKEQVKAYLEAFDELIGLKYVNLIHLNDCKVDVGEHKDRHDNIGEGKIGLTGLQMFFDFFKKLKIPIVLETPNYGYETEIKMLDSQK